MIKIFRGKNSLLFTHVGTSKNCKKLTNNFAGTRKITFLQKLPFEGKLKVFRTAHIFVLSSMLLYISTGYVFPQSLCIGMGVPWASEKEYAMMPYFGFNGDSKADIEAFHYDVFTSQFDTPFSLTELSVGAGPFSSNAFFLSFPELYQNPQIAPFSIPVLMGGLTLPEFFIKPEVYLFQGFIPTIQTNIESQRVSLCSDPITGVGTILKRGAFSLFALYGSGQGCVQIESNQVGSVQTRIVFAGCQYKSFGVFYNRLEEQLDVSAYAYIMENIGISILSSGRFLADSFCIWGAWEHQSGSFILQIYSLLGLCFVPEDDIEFSYTYTQNNEVKERLTLTFQWDPALITVFRPRLTWKISSQWQLVLQRWLLYQQGWDVNVKKNDIATPVQTTPSSYKLDPYTLFFAGLELSILYTLQ